MLMHLISDNIDTKTGLRLVGIKGTVAHTENEVCEALEKAAADKNIGIIIITEKLAVNFPAVFDKFRAEHKLPLLAEIPDRHGSGRGENYLKRFFKGSV
ncbi:MAG: V-type ATP synthase subunit F [Defluviitaleaceae bacterium]|nr:V-type ATP synthase subunit F [Defluviitaleaceae bacterium]